MREKNADSSCFLTRKQIRSGFTFEECFFPHIRSRSRPSGGQSFKTFYICHWTTFSNAYTGKTKGGKYHCTVDLLFDWLGIRCMTIDNFCFYLQNRLIRTGQTGGQLYSDTCTFSVPSLTALKFRAT